jgi:hypothetical protein
MSLLRTVVLLGSLAFAVVAGPACGSDDTTDPTLLADGVHGPQKVPAGGSVSGESAGGTVVQSLNTGAAIIVDTQQGMTTSVKNLTVDCRGGVGMIIRGNGDFVGDNLTFKCSRGVGIAAEGLGKLKLSNTKVSGNVTYEGISQLAFPVSWDKAPIVGIVLSKVSSAEFTAVDVNGFAGFGAIVVGSTTTWTGGRVSGNVGVGIMADAGDTTLSAVSVEQTWNGQTGYAIASYGVLIADKAAFHTTGMSVLANEGLGFLQDGATSSHTGLVVKDNKGVGLWVQNTSGTAAAPAFLIDGTGNELRGNKGGGIFAIGSGGISLRGLTASDAVDAQITDGETGLTTMADGVQIANPTGDLVLQDLALDNNNRVGLLLSGASPSSVSITGVSVGGNGKYGVVAQNGFDRPTVNYTNPELKGADESLTGTIGVAKAKEGFASVSAIGSGGLIGAGGIFDNDGNVGANGQINTSGGLGGK